MEDIRKGVCPLCGHREILEAPGVRVEEGRTHPLALSYLVRNRDSTGPRTIEFGSLKSYSCTGCGYTQWFVADPKRPIGAPGTRVLKGPEPAGPYR